MRRQESREIRDAWDLRGQLASQERQANFFDLVQQLRVAATQLVVPGKARRLANDILGDFQKLGHAAPRKEMDL